MPSRATALATAALTACALGVGCAGSPRTPARVAPAPRSSSAAPAPVLVTPARLFAIPDESAGFSSLEPDGTRRVIARGMRLIEHTDGSLERGTQLLPAGRAARPVELPSRL